MSDKTSATTTKVMLNPNGPGAAAVLAAGIGSLAIAVFAILANQIATIKSLMVFYKPTGPLSGVTTCSIIVWFGAWIILHRRWRTRQISARFNTVALVFLFLALLLTFPPIADLF